MFCSPKSKFRSFSLKNFELLSPKFFTPIFQRMFRKFSWFFEFVSQYIYDDHLVSMGLCSGPQNVVFLVKTSLFIATFLAGSLYFCNVLALCFIAKFMIILLTFSLTNNFGEVGFAVCKLFHMLWVLFCLYLRFFRLNCYYCTVQLLSLWLTSDGQLSTSSAKVARLSHLYVQRSPWLGALQSAASGLLNITIGIDVDCATA